MFFCFNADKTSDKNLLLKHAHFFAHADIKKSVVTAFFKFVKELAELLGLMYNDAIFPVLLKHQPP